MSTASSRRIAFVLAALRGGGAERVAFNLVQGMIERGLAVDIVVMARKASWPRKFRQEHAWSILG